MKSKGLLLLWTFWVFFAGLSSANQKDIRQSSSFIHAIRYFHENKERFDRIGAECGLPAPMVYAVVAPEIAQFNAFSNVFETLSLKLMYVQKGSGFFDFSIGVFQMKPSFVESLERYVAANAVSGVNASEIIIHEQDPLKQRAERIRRLESEEWQYRYLQLFLKIVTLRIGNQMPVNEGEKLSVLATAYNAGFLKDIPQLRKHMRYSYFPVYSPFRAYPYSKVSLIFYQMLS
jgi:hypothetical protein